MASCPLHVGRNKQWWIDWLAGAVAAISVEQAWLLHPGRKPKLQAWLG